MWLPTPVGNSRAIVDVPVRKAQAPQRLPRGVDLMCRHQGFRVKDNQCEFVGELEPACAAGLYRIGLNKPEWLSLRAFLRTDREELKEYFRLYAALTVKGRLAVEGYETGEGRVEVAIRPHHDHPVVCRVTMAANGPDKDAIPFYDWGNQVQAHAIADRAKNAP